MLDLAHPKIESALESRVWYFLWSNTFPALNLRWRSATRAAWLVARVDFVWLTAGVFLEADGREKYLQHRRPG